MLSYCHTLVTQFATIETAYRSSMKLQRKVRVSFERPGDACLVAFEQLRHNRYADEPQLATVFVHFHSHLIQFLATLNTILQDRTALNTVGAFDKTFDKIFTEDFTNCKKLFKPDDKEIVSFMPFFDIQFY